ncbi:MAG: addiction module protein [Gemmatimonadota bacterium]
MRCPRCAPTKQCFILETNLEGRKCFMFSAAEELEAAALSLPVSERARLAERLIASLDEETEIEQAWALEVRRRLESYRAGEIDSIPADEVINEARNRLA